MTKEKRSPLGYVNVSGGKLAIYPTNHVFLAYTFDKKEYWEALRLIVNILIAKYKCKHPTSRLQPLTGKIVVETEFSHLMTDDARHTREQDIRIIGEDSDLTFVEFHNFRKSSPIVEVRSVGYYGHGLVTCKGKTANQIWILAENVEELQRGESIRRYVLMDEVEHLAHPVDSGIMYVCLKSLSKERCPAGELASFLLGGGKKLKNSAVEKIAKMLGKSYEQFQKEKEDVMILTMFEKAFADGEARGEARVANLARTLLEQGLDATEIVRIISSLDESAPDENAEPAMS